MDLGFERDTLLSFGVDPSLNGYSPERIRRLAESVQQKLAAIPGVRSAAVGVNPVIADNVDYGDDPDSGAAGLDDEDMSPYVDCGESRVLRDDGHPAAGRARVHGARPPGARHGWRS